MPKKYKRPKIKQEKVTMAQHSQFLDRKKDQEPAKEPVPEPAPKVPEEAAPLTTEKAIEGEVVKQLPPAKPESAKDEKS